MVSRGLILLWFAVRRLLSDTTDSISHMRERERYLNILQMPFILFGKFIHLIVGPCISIS